MPKKLANSPALNSWRAMRQRCLSKSSYFFHRYGGRGISICPSWINSFDQFLLDMGERPLGHSLDRIDNDGNYCKENCRWATPEAQIENRSTTKRWVVFGETLTKREIANRFKLPIKRVAYLIQKQLNGKSTLEESLSPLKEISA